MQSTAGTLAQRQARAGAWGGAWSREGPPNHGFKLNTYFKLEVEESEINDGNGLVFYAVLLHFWSDRALCKK